MSAESEQPRDTLADQLATFDARLESMSDDVDMLADIQAGISGLLTTSGSTEAEIRQVLQERYEAGDLRKETFQLVKSMLDRYAVENAPVTPTGTVVLNRPPPISPDPEPPSSVSNEDSFGATTVLPNDILPLNDADARVQVGSILRDRFLLQERISGGSMGVVYKALDRRLAEAQSPQVNVAIKVLSPALAENGPALRALQQEAAKTRCLVHPHIVRFIDLDRDDDLYFLVLEWLEGRTLADILDSPDARSIDTEAAFRIVRQVGEALDYAHRCGIVHADVKPGNIMIMPNGDAKLFDFGVARVRQKQADTDFDPGVLGAVTPAYSSLQVLGGEEPVAADDVFSLACLLYRLLAGYRVFGPRNAAEASEAGMRPQRPQALDDDQWNALRKALSYARVTRYKSVSEFLEALGHHTAPQPVDDTITIAAPERFATDDDGGSPGKWIAVLVVLIGLGGIGANQLGYLDPWLDQIRDDGELLEIAPPETIVEQLVDDPVAEVSTPDIEPSAGDSASPEAAEPKAVEPADRGGTDIRSNEIGAVEPATGGTADTPVPAGPAPAAKETAETSTIVDFSRLPPANAIVHINPRGDEPARAQVTLREDGDPVTLDFIRDGAADAALALRLEEVAFSGGTSPWAAGQYALSNAGLIAFPAGQQRARITIRMASDPRREADQQSTLRLRPDANPDAAVAVIQVTLEDDDRRDFEARLPANTIGFAINQISVRESDPAVQIDVMRFNPDNTAMTVGFTVEGLTATEGEDYFGPEQYELSFAAGQRSARLLVPLVQDSLAEGDEAFVVKLDVDKDAQPIDVSPNIAVMIRDDE